MARPDDHHREHGHYHTPAGDDRRFAVGIALNAVFVAVEAISGFVANSLALIADAGHNLSDVLGLALAWGALYLSRKAPSAKFTYGLRSSSILAAVANAMLLLFACGAIALEAVQRFRHAEAVSGKTVMIVAAIGIVINVASAALFLVGRKTDLNIRGAFVHMAADAAVSLAVVLAGLAILMTGRLWLDPAISLVVVLVILAVTWGLFKDSLSLALHAVPSGIDTKAVEQYFAALPGVTQVHDLHIWGMSTTETALTAHLVMPAGHPGDGWTQQVTEELEHRFGIHHPTLQIELGEHVCALSHEGVV
jgi:cobalt-zinc-cadmium efflux system protein